MRTILVFLLLVSPALATPCDDARRDFQRAKQFGAFDFHCRDRYDGTCTSSWRMDPESFKLYRESERQRKMRKRK